MFGTRSGHIERLEKERFLGVLNLDSKSRRGGECSRTNPVNDKIWQESSSCKYFRINGPPVFLISIIVEQPGQAERWGSCLGDKSPFLETKIQELNEFIH